MTSELLVDRHNLSRYRRELHGNKHIYQYEGRIDILTARTISDAALTLSTAPIMAAQSLSTPCKLVNDIKRERTALLDLRALLRQLNEDDVSQARLCVVRDCHRPDIRLVIKDDGFVVTCVLFGYGQRHVA